MNTNPTKVITEKCRLSYEHLWEPGAMEGSDKLKYSASVIIRKDDRKTLDRIQAAVDAAIQEGIKSKWKGRKPGVLKLPLRDGDAERPDDPVYRNAWFLNAYADTSRQPGIVDMSRQPILDRSEVYSGCWCRFSLSFYPFAGMQNGVAVGLNNVQKVSDGERLGGVSSAEDDFDDDWTDEFRDLL